VPPSAAATPPTEGAVLVRLAALDRTWATALPRVPDGRVLTVTVGHPDLVPVPADDLTAAGYRIAGVASARRPVGSTIDVLVPHDLRVRHPGWWRALAQHAIRIFDLRMGPVRVVLAAELELHLRAAHDEPHTVR
jgi:hypothetical protein